MQREAAVSQNYPINCRHFNGAHRKVCDVGINYRDEFFSRKLNLPCHHGPKFAGREMGTCGKCEYETQEDANARWQALIDAADAFERNITEGRCPVCGAPIEPSQIVCRCKYASCGHRLGQVATEDP